MEFASEKAEMRVRKKKEDAAAASETKVGHSSQQHKSPISHGHMTTTSDLPTLLQDEKVIDLESQEKVVNTSHFNSHSVHVLKYTLSRSMKNIWPWKTSC